ncbi:23S rRNA (adenine(2503)-C(2))-methyltransferase RlmN [Tumebacillus permanentifrigoris]|uniref:Probable dual-specificity RNA methyltransferase RlmN n=1 Tax=Tumebacillus permanentifrigoris TaxID=378543 RepID=A0A316D992_9BACL|nr:23S rRNA (adenine(2503)-C(2))-methyltransferase RlmN [Tumebacillus permanentifrigoris]PWK12798.1 23S rRNA m(2)A-2503 methyltransferase [Tumebacillus permanentifrigoris]
MSVIETLELFEQKRPQQLLDMKLDELEVYVQSLGQPKFRGKQIFAWLHQQRVTSVDEMTNLPQKFREQLQEVAAVTTMKEVTRQESVDGTIKWLWELYDGSTIETVLMRHEYGNSVCVSSQVGCRMGCTFCASTLGGLVRHLSGGEIVEQLLNVQRFLDVDNERVSSVVLMGSGEPLENYDAAMKFVDLINDPNGLGIGARHITVSTVGLVPAIRRLADEKRQITLAISLHATRDEIRSAMMPINKAYSIDQLLDACKYYFKQTGRRISFEYALVGGKNDDIEHARELAGLIGHMDCHVNLIPVNYVPERNYTRTPKDQIRAFVNELTRLGVNATVRREKGHDIAAACGQLRAEQGRN